MGRDRCLPIDLPPIYRNVVWHYHGIEANIAYKEHHKDTERETYHFHAISDVDGRTEIETRKGKTIDVPSMKLETFFDKIGIAFCDLLVVDVEGMEWEIFQAYSGRVPIEHAIVEFHHTREREEPTHTEDAFKYLLESKGFEIMCRHLTNCGGTQEWTVRRQT
ncbi:MAG: FkbM family methyltransferase [Candidatus Poribacteria bacterium]|nr:FkbM family methyltransferase [Candidatus Poribacteria bacterium]